MKVRGRRRCVECGERWSYYETGSVECPGCGSPRSVGVDDERTLHTDAPVELDLDGARRGVDERPLEAVASDAEDAAREYVLSRGFIDAGTLLPLDGVVVAAAELRHAAAAVGRRMRPSEDEERYFLALLAGADGGDRPDDVPSGMRGARGLGAVDALGAYRSDLSAWLDERPDPEARTTLGTLREHEKRVEALDGDVPPSEADGLVEAARGVGTYLREDDASALASARDRLGRLG